MSDHRANLAKLAAYLDTLPDDYEAFEMRTFFGAARNIQADPDVEADYGLHNGGVDKCGAVACAIGHGPSAGILLPPALISDLTKRVNWWGYIDRFFIPESRETEYAFAWMFGADWSLVDNTPRGAAKRIRFYLQNGHGFTFDDDWGDYDTTPNKSHLALYQDY